METMFWKEFQKLLIRPFWGLLFCKCLEILRWLLIQYELSVSVNLKKKKKKNNSQNSFKLSREALNHPGTFTFILFYVFEMPKMPVCKHNIWLSAGILRHLNLSFFMYHCFWDAELSSWHTTLSFECLWKSLVVGTFTQNLA